MLTDVEIAQSAKMKPCLLYTSTIATRVIELNANGCLDRLSSYDEFLEYKEKMEA